MVLDPTRLDAPKTNARPNVREIVPRLPRRGETKLRGTHRLGARVETGLRATRRGEGRGGDTGAPQVKPRGKGISRVRTFSFECTHRHGHRYRYRQVSQVAGNATE